MPTVNIDSTLTMSYEDHWYGDPWRQPEVALLIHGVAESSRAWYAWVPHLARELRVLRPDQRGFGRSTVPPPGYAWTIAGFAADLARFLDAVGVASAHVVGAKLGGTIALQFAADYPDRTRTLSVLSGPVRARNTGGRIDLTAFPERIRAIGVGGWAAETQRARLGSEVAEEHIAWWSSFMAQTDPRVCVEITAAVERVDVSGLLPSIKARSLIATSERSPLASVEVVREWARLIPNAEVLVVPGDGYHIAAAKPDECAQHVLAFIKRAAAKEKV
ncbi:MAG: alpha/beta hydrolase [Chloroflexi bacterium]|nr:alpha/beta hydrolase [Chloroflexota bacterium]